MKVWKVIILGICAMAIIGIIYFSLRNHNKKKEVANMINISSPAFANEGEIPQKYTCDGEDINPPLEISNVPEGTKSLVLIVYDPDAPRGPWTHWVLFNIPPETATIAENSTPAGATAGQTSAKDIKYGGPCPPSGSHRYYFTVFALKDTLDLPEGATRDELETDMQDETLGQGELMGKYARKD
jgi:hypothetical protein